jgi:hypothetical protein
MSPVGKKVPYPRGFVASHRLPLAQLGPGHLEFLLARL